MNRPHVERFKLKVFISDKLFLSFCDGNEKVMFHIIVNTVLTCFV